MSGCAVKHCSNHIKKGGCKKITFHLVYPWSFLPVLLHRIHDLEPCNYLNSDYSFPKDLVLARKWSEIVRQSRNESWWKPNTRTCICSAHFAQKDKYFTKSGQQRIKKGVVPSEDLFLSSTNSGSYKTEDDDADVVNVVKSNTTVELSDVGSTSSTDEGGNTQIQTVPSPKPDALFLPIKYSDSDETEKLYIDNNNASCSETMEIKPDPDNANIAISNLPSQFANFAPALFLPLKRSNIEVMEIKPDPDNVNIAKSNPTSQFAHFGPASYSETMEIKPDPDNANIAISNLPSQFANFAPALSPPLIRLNSVIMEIKPDPDNVNIAKPNPSSQFANFGPTEKGGHIKKIAYPMSQLASYSETMEIKPDPDNANIAISNLPSQFANFAPALLPPLIRSNTEIMEIKPDPDKVNIAKPNSTTPFANVGSALYPPLILSNSEKNEIKPDPDNVNIVTPNPTSHFANFSTSTVGVTKQVSVDPISTLEELGSSDDSLFDTPEKSKMRKILRRKLKIVSNQTLKIKALQQKNRRLLKRNGKLRVIIKSLKRQRYVNTEMQSILSQNTFAAQLYTILYKKNCKNKKRPMPTYTDEFKKFCMTLNDYSPKAYRFVRRSFNTCLPHPKTLATWYHSDDGAPEPPGLPQAIEKPENGDNIMK